MVKVILFILRMYQKFLSPLLGQRCRFYPSCSNYAMQAFSKYGIIKGFYLSLKRILKCNPFHKGGYDPL
ncbi:MAG: membrane protein insertion efficiency factor YidD [Chlamydiota bacterium]|nr:MAG: membrane protein insertion efficiency factor YidD [Chlamydiae bacterium CG10_big_fil_rev_8_21_14_0_10_35_9]